MLLSQVRCMLVNILLFAGKELSELVKLVLFALDSWELPLQDNMQVLHQRWYLRPAAHDLYFIKASLVLKQSHDKEACLYITANISQVSRMQSN